MNPRVPAPEPRAARRCWFWLGCTAFGGQATQVALMRAELIERRRWISEARFQHALDYCKVLPGAEAQQLVTYVGWLLHGARAGMVAGALYVAPSVLLMMALAWAYLAFGHLPAMAAALQSARPVVVAILLTAAIRSATRALRTPWQWGIAIAAFAAIGLLALPLPLVIAAGALIGATIGRVGDSTGRAAAPGKAVGETAGAADHVIGDGDPPPPHAVFRLRQSLIVVGLGMLLGWAVYQLVTLLLTGNGSTGPALAAFHAKAALVSFGSAYAMLPYVYAIAVEQYQWLSAGQLIDGLALAKATPGPLMTIVAFIGFLAGWSTQFAAVGMPWLSALCGGLVAVFFALLPSFVLVLAGAPFIEGTRHRPALRAPLAGISAAVIGAIASLAVHCSGHVFITLDQRFDWSAIGIALVALVLLLRWKLGAALTLAMAAGCGLARAYLGI